MDTETKQEIASLKAHIRALIESVRILQSLAGEHEDKIQAILVAWRPKPDVHPAP